MCVELQRPWRNDVLRLLHHHPRSSATLLKFLGVHVPLENSVEIAFGNEARRRPLCERESEGGLFCQAQEGICRPGKCGSAVLILNLTA